MDVQVHVDGIGPGFWTHLRISIVYFQHDGGLPFFLYEFLSLVDDQKEFSPDALDRLVREFRDVFYESEGSIDTSKEDNDNDDENGTDGSDKVTRERRETSVNMTKFYAFAGHQMHKMLLKCSWRRKPCRAANFIPTFTDAGKF